MDRWIARYTYEKGRDRETERKKRIGKKERVVKGRKKMLYIISIYGTISQDRSDKSKIFT